MAEVPVALTRAGYEKLKRELAKLQLQYTNLNRKLQHYSRQPGARSMAIRLYVGKAVLQISSGAEGSVYEYKGDPGSETATGRVFSNCYNRTGISIEADTWCLVIILGRRRYVTPWECP